MTGQGRSGSETRRMRVLVGVRLYPAELAQARVVAAAQCPPCTVPALIRTALADALRRRAGRPLP
jgi:hypothetical protein